MDKKEMIRELEEEKDLYLLKAERLQSAIDNLKPIEESDVKEKITPKGLKKMHKTISGNKRKRSVGKWTDEIISFIKNNANNMGNDQLAKEIQKKFNLKCAATNVANTMFNHNIHRDKKKVDRSKIASDAYKKKWPNGHPIQKKSQKKCEYCPKPATCMIGGKAVCNRDFDLIKNGPDFVKRKEKGETGYYDQDIEIDDINEALE